MRQAGLTSSAPVTVNAGPSPTDVVAEDFDGDGIPDLAVSNFESRSVSFLRGRGDGGFRPRVVSRTVRQPWHLASADVNADGRPDLITASTDRPEALAVLINAGAGRFRLGQVYRQRGGAETVATADVNLDSITDLVAPDSYARLTPTVLLGLGAGSFRPVSAAAPRVSAEDVAVGDLNRDGRPDLVLVDEVELAIRLGTGDGTFGGARTFRGGDVPRAVAVADVNHDGLLDVTVASESESALPSAVSLFLGNGDGTLKARTAYPLRGGARVLTVAATSTRTATPTCSPPSRRPCIAVAATGRSKRAERLRGGAPTAAPSPTSTSTGCRTSRSCAIPDSPQSSWAGPARWLRRASSTRSLTDDYTL